MNCRPGDLAVIVADALTTKEKTGGLLVTVLHRCHGKLTTLPDGVESQSANSDWVVEFQRPITIRKGVGYRAARYACCPDSKLRPLRDPGEDARDESLSWLEVPTKETA